MSRVKKNQEVNNVEVQKVKPRRKNGEGSLLTDDNGKMKKNKDGYYVQTLSYMKNGKQKRLPVYGKTAEELFRKVEQKKFELNHESVDINNHDTLNGYFKFWIESRKSTKSDEDNTIKGYESKYKNTWQNTIGNKKLKSISTQDIQQVINDRINGQNGMKKLGSNGMIDTFILLHQILESAQTSTPRMIVTNPADGDIRLPKRTRAKKTIFKKGGAEQFFEVAVDNKNFAGYVLLIYTGSRRMEVCGMSWDQVNFENRLITISQQLDRDGKTIKNHLKSKDEGEIKKVKVPQFVIDVLRTHKANQNKNRLALGSKYDVNGYNLILANKEGNPINHTSFYRTFKRLIKEAGLDPNITFHSARHNFASSLFRGGADEGCVMGTLGHDDLRTTSTYTHTDEDQDNLVAEIMEQEIKINPELLKKFAAK